MMVNRIVYKTAILFLVAGVHINSVEAHQSSELPSYSTMKLYPIIFNTPEIVSGIMFTPIGYPINYQMSQEQLSAIFPLLDLIITDEDNVVARYNADGSLAKVSIVIRQLDLDIRVGIGLYPESLMYAIGFFAEDEIIQYSYVHGVPVTVFMHERWASEIKRFEARFKMGDIGYLVRFTDYEESGKARMTEIVNRIILGGTEGLDAIMNLN